MFEDRLLAGETILWTGHPRQGLLLRPIELLLFPFSLLWGGFALFWNASVWTTDAPLTFKLFGLPFLLMGLYIVAGRFWIDAAARRRTVYALTNRRALIERRFLSTAFKSVDLRKATALELSEKGNGSGTIRFAPSPSIFAGNGFAFWSPGFDPTPQFLEIGDVKTVYALIEQQVE